MLENDPLFGAEWNMNPEASIFSGAFTPVQESRVYEPIENGYTLTVTGERDGTAYRWGYTAVYDGRPHPVTGRPDVDAITIYRLDDRHTVGPFMKALSPGGPYARTVSEDGSTLTVEAAGRNADGSPFYDVIEYRRAE